LGPRLGLVVGGDFEHQERAILAADGGLEIQGMLPLNYWLSPCFFVAGTLGQAWDWERGPGSDDYDSSTLALEIGFGGTWYLDDRLSVMTRLAAVETVYLAPRDATGRRLQSQLYGPRCACWSASDTSCDWYRLTALYAPAPAREPLDEVAASRAYRRWRWRMFIGFFSGYFILYFCRKNISNALPAMAGDLGYSNTELGLIGTALYVVYGIGKLANGVLADRSHIRRFMATGLIVSGAFNLLFPSAHAVWLLALVWGCNGWFQSMGFPPIARGLTLWFRRGQELALGAVDLLPPGGDRGRHGLHRLDPDLGLLA